jgi:hypothetical protein
MLQRLLETSPMESFACYIEAKVKVGIDHQLDTIGLLRSDSKNFFDCTVSDTEELLDQLMQYWESNHLFIDFDFEYDEDDDIVIHLYHKQYY